MRLKKLSVLLSIPVLVLSLVPCGSDSKGESKETSGGGKTATASTNQPSIDPPPAIGSSSASQSGDSSSTDLNSGDEGSGNNAQKPSKEAAVAGMSRMVKELPRLKNLKVPKQVPQNLSMYIVDKIYDKATPVTLNDLATGRTTAPLSRSDSALIKSSTLQCVDQLKQQIEGGAGSQ